MRVLRSIVRPALRDLAFNVAYVFHSSLVATQLVGHDELG